MKELTKKMHKNKEIPSVKWNSMHKKLQKNKDFSNKAC